MTLASTWGLLNLADHISGCSIEPLMSRSASGRMWKHIGSVTGRESVASSTSLDLIQFEIKKITRCQPKTADDGDVGSCMRVKARMGLLSWWQQHLTTEWDFLVRELDSTVDASLAMNEVRLDRLWLAMLMGEAKKKLMTWGYWRSWCPWILIRPTPMNSWKVVDAWGDASRHRQDSGDGRKGSGNDCWFVSFFIFLFSLISFSGFLFQVKLKR